MFPKPKKKAKTRRNYKKFREMVLEADNRTCKNPWCPFKGSIKSRGLIGAIMDAHHIIKEWLEDTLRNGITLCRYCHEAVEGRRSILINGEKWRGRPLMRIILESWLGTLCFRWGAALKKLKERY